MSDNKTFSTPMAEALSNIERLEQRLHADWTHLKKARQLALAKRVELQTALAGLDSEDTSIVVSGSLARDEFTEGSDIDWTLLIDGSADPGHYELTARIKVSVDRIAAKSTGAEGLFSTMVFSHDLIHQIGGDDDTNRNTTRRLLLLLESCAVGREAAHRRVTRNILNRYLLEDRGFWRGSQYRVPRFLQNDFARYWRTITVDFAYKLRSRAGKGSAIRNAKLRIVLLRFPRLDQASTEIFGSYNDFLGLLANPKSRHLLETITEDRAETDPTFLKARSLSHTFRDGLMTIFFDPQSGLEELTKNYGVF